MWVTRLSPHVWTGVVMKRVFVIAACCLSLAACSSLPSWMQFDSAKFAGATTVQFESEPAGAEARTSTGQTCRTPCSLAVEAREFTVSYSLPGYQSQTVPVRSPAPDNTRDPNSINPPEAPGVVPNPVFVELQPAAPPPVAHKKPVARKKPVAQAAAPTTTGAKPTAKPAPTAMAPESPAPAPASPWPPAPPSR